MKLSIISLALGLSVSGLAHAQNPALNASASITAQKIETISISGSRTPMASQFVAGSLSVIDAFQIEASGALTLTELLRTIPSVNISSSGPLGSLTELRFRGSESNHVLVMLDGVEINDLGQGGLIDLSHLLLANISRIEVLRGPQSALWGSAAVAGVINITSKQPRQNNGHGGHIKASYGNKKTSQLYGRLSGASDDWQYSVSASELSTDGENIARRGNEADGYRNTSLYSKLGYTFSAHNRINANLRLLDYRNDFDTTDPATGLLTDANNVTDGKQLSLGINWHFSLPESIWSQSLSLQYGEQENRNTSGGTFSGSTKGEKLRTVYNHNFTLSRGHLNVGLEAIDERFKQAGPIVFGDPNQSQSNQSQSLIADAHHQLNAVISMTASARYDNNQEFDNAGSYRIGLNYQFSKDIRGYVSHGEAVKNPTFTERFGFFPGTFLGNTDLVPESSTSSEMGISAALFNYEVQLSWYRAKLEDEILGFVFDEETALFTAQNAELTSEREGLELQVSQQLNNWQWSLSYAYLEANEAQSAELRRARHTGSASVIYEVNDKDRWYLQADYTGNRLDRFFPPFPQSAQTVSLDSYWLVSANYRHSINGKTDLSLRISNALNSNFEDVVGFSGESRRIIASIEYRF
jgi:vitamin B12 transporter